MAFSPGGRPSFQRCRPMSSGISSRDSQLSWLVLPARRSRWANPRNCGLAIFPFALRGNALRICTERGTMYFGRCLRQAVRTSSDVTSGVGPGGDK